MRCDISFVFFVLVVTIGQSQQRKIREGECEVCIAFMQKFMDQLNPDIKSNPAKIEQDFKAFCKKARGKEERLCWYVGGMETSATYILPEMAKPVSWGMPADKVCEKLNAKDSQVCELRLAVQRDLSTVDLNKLKVKDLKQILSDWGEECQGCSEKSEFVSRVKELMPKYFTPKDGSAAKTGEL